MKFKIRIKNGKATDFMTYTEQGEYTTKYVEIEPLPPKEGYYIDTYLDETEVTVKQRYVAIPKTEEEKVQEAIQKELSKTIDVDNLTAEQIKEKLLVFPAYTQETEYKKDDVVRKLGKLYKCLKPHKSSYDLLPELNSDYWQEVKGKDVKPQVTREFWSEDKTYRKGDEVIYYSKPYRYIDPTPKAGIRPEGSPKQWELIEE